MEKIRQAEVILFFALFVSTLAFSASQKSSVETYLEELHNQGKERVIVLFENETDPNIIAKYDTKLIRQLKIINALICEINQGDIEQLKQEEKVKDVVPDMLIRIPEPSKPEPHPHQIAPLSYDGPVTVRWNNLQAGLNSKAAWDNYNLDGTGIKIAFIDQGVNYTLPDIDANYIGGWDFIEGDDDPFTDNVDEYHGTMVVAIAVGEGDSQIVGPVYNASYYALRETGPTGTGLISNLISAIEWASTESHKADIISMSLGTYGGGVGWENIWKPALRNACNAAYEAGIVLVAASGNEGYDYSRWPARFDNVISVGGHAEEQTLYDYNGKSTNGGVDVIAPGARVLAIGPDNSTWWCWGTSFATPHASALLALQLQYTRQNNIEANNGYNWEVMKHSAVDLGHDPIYQGKGKIYAAQTDSNDPNIGSIDLIAANWPIDYDFEFSDYAFADGNYPAYHIGSDVNQTITLTNITDILGNTTETIENLTVTIKQVYYDHPNEPNLPGDSNQVFPIISTFYPGDGNSIELSLLYTIPPATASGLVQTKLQLEFNFLGNSRAIRVCYYQPNLLWYAAIPGDLNLDNTVNMTDFSMFSQRWQNSGCVDPDYCQRADVNRSGSVDWNDVSVLATNWLTN